MKNNNFSPTSVINISTGGYYDIYIGRGSKWGNPFKIGVHGNRVQVIEMFKKYLISNVDLMSQIHELSGKILGCHCKPKGCHGDIYCDILNVRLFEL